MSQPPPRQRDLCSWLVLWCGDVVPLWCSGSSVWFVLQWIWYGVKCSWTPQGERVFWLMFDLQCLWRWRFPKTWWWLMIGLSDLPESEPALYSHSCLQTGATSGAAPSCGMYVCCVCMYVCCCVCMYVHMYFVHVHTYSRETERCLMFPLCHLPCYTRCRTLSNVI